LPNVALAAGFDVTFGIDLSLVEIQDGIFTSYPMDMEEALRKGLALYIDTCRAFAQVIVDPIKLGFSCLKRTSRFENLTLLWRLNFDPMESLQLQSMICHRGV
jgi:hypothetical protein